MEYAIKGSRGADARGISIADGFTVLKGSKVASGTTPSFSVSLQKMRNRLIETGVIDSNFLFARDYLFTNPSTAASIVRGASSNGRTQWKNQNGLTLAMVEAMEISE